MKRIICWFKKAWVWLRWTNDKPALSLGVRSPCVGICDRWEEVVSVLEKINQKVGKQVFRMTSDPHEPNVFINLSSALPEGVDGRAYQGGRKNDDGMGQIVMRSNLDTETFKTVLAHELIHVLGHWHHGTSYLMQPSIVSCMGLDALLDDKIVNWVKENT